MYLHLIQNHLRFCITFLQSNKCLLICCHLVQKAKTDLIVHFLLVLDVLVWGCKYYQNNQQQLFLYLLGIGLNVCENLEW